MLGNMDAGSRTIVRYMIIIAIVTTSTTTALESIMGKMASCTNEGEEIALDSIKDMKCYKCICQNGFVVCESDTTCPPVDDCYMLEKKKGCCEKCKECSFEGKNYPSGAEWTAKDDPCRNLKCLAGVVTTSNLQCYTPCDNPLPPRPGQCCPTCLGCHLSGQFVHDGREVSLSEDPCLKCSCSSKRLTCVKKACPILQCPVSKQIRTPGECCPRCSEKRLITQVAGKCILGKGFHADGTKFSPDHCSTSCMCTNGTSVCRRHTCPVLECAADLQQMGDNCCLYCPEIAQVKSTCSLDGKNYQLNDTWNMGTCISCICQSGGVRCVKTNCEKQRCKPNESLVTPPGQCCSKCVETPGVCTVFGDPHYKTFDGKFFSFKGSCKYQLTADCYNHTFSIRVTNDGRNTKSSAWTKTVTLKMADVKVNLGQKMRIKVNGSRVTLPYRLGSTLDIVATDDGVSVRTDIGIQLLWDGNNFLQVQAAASFKNRLCGLCGNYNNIWRDDLISRRGINFSDEEVWRFATSWQVGGPKACTRKHENLAKQPMCRHKEGASLCKALQSDMFEECGTKMNPNHYFESCKKDMCECPTGKCYCDSFAAYARECSRLGVRLPDWKGAVGCEVVTRLPVAAVPAVLSVPAAFGHNNAIAAVKSAREHHLQQQQLHQKLKRHHKKKKRPAPDFLNKHIPKTFLIQKHAGGRTPPPLH